MTRHEGKHAKFDTISTFQCVNRVITFNYTFIFYRFQLAKCYYPCSLLFHFLHLFSIKKIMIYLRNRMVIYSNIKEKK